MNVAILGTRGIPASYSGFETAVEQITSRLTARGHRVTVYCRPHVVDPLDLASGRARELVHLPTVRNKYLDTFVHTFLSSAARRVRAEARRRAVLHRRQQPALPDHARARDPDA